MNGNFAIAKSPYENSEDDLTIVDLTEFERARDPLKVIADLARSFLRFMFPFAIYYVPIALFTVPFDIFVNFSSEFTRILPGTMLIYAILFLTLWAYLVSSAFNKFRVDYLVLSLLLIYLCLLALRSFFLPETASDPDSSTFMLGPDTLEKVAFSAPFKTVFVIYVGLISFYFIVTRTINKQPAFKNLTRWHAAPLRYFLTRYSVVSKKGMLFVVPALIGNAFLTTLGFFLISSMLMLIPYMSGWIAVPATFFIYAWPQYGRHYEAFRRESALSASDLYEIDARGKILYLRSFGTETLLIPRPPLIRSWFPTAETELATLEEVLIAEAFNYGPVGALGDPGKKLQPLGAARDLVADEEWRIRVQRQMRFAQDVLYVVGDSPQLNWELSAAVEMGCLSKIIFVFPPRWRVHADNKEIYTYFLSISGFPARFADLPVVLFREPKGGPVLITGAEQSAQEYSLALRSALQTRRA